MCDEINLSRFIFFFFFITVISAAQGQSFMRSYWVTSQGDSIHGFVKNTITAGQYLLAKYDSASNSTIQLSPDSIVSVFQNGIKIYRNAPVFFKGHKSFIFLELIEEGRANLYRGTFGDLEKLFYVEKDGQLFMINKPDINGFLKNLLGKCFDETIIPKNLYRESKIREAITAYNHCADPSVPVNTNLFNNNTPKFYMGGKLNYNIGKFRFPEHDYYHRGDFSGINNPGIGITARVNFVNNIFLQAEFDFLKKHAYSNNISASFFNPESYSRVTLDFSYLNFPLYVGYNFGHTSFKVLIAAGINMESLLSGGIKDVPGQLDPGEHGPPYTYFDKFDFGFLGMVGAQYKVQDKTLLVLSLKYTSSDSNYKLVHDSVTGTGYGAGASNLNSRIFEISFICFFEI